MRPCPAADDLTDFLDDRSAEGALALESHLEECAHCLGVFERMLSERELHCFGDAAADSLNHHGRLHDSEWSTRLPTIPGYQVLEFLGRGGHGVVYRARDLHLQREVALKLLKAGEFASAKECAQLFVEAQAAARIKHPNIVQVYSVGDFNGLPFFAMDCHAGGSLAGRVRGGPIPPRETAELMEKVARAVHFAHEQGVIHRDLKPANILLADDSLAYPSVSDFGLAKCAALNGEATPSDAVFGTPKYMAPELFAGNAKKANAASDIYSLGAVLYELLTGRPPFEGETSFETILLTREAEAEPPRRLNPSVPADLETICLKCLEKSPDRRYTTAAAVAADLQRFLAGERIAAARPGRIALAWHHVTKVPRNAIAAIVLPLIVLAGVAWLTKASASAELDRQISSLLSEPDGDKIVSILKQLEPARAEVEPILRARAIAQAPDSLARRNAALFLIATDPSEGTYLLRCIRSTGPEETATLHHIVRTHKDLADHCDFLWASFTRQPPETSDTRLRIACILAGCAPADERWSKLAPELVDLMIDGNADATTVRLLSPINDFLVLALMDFLSEPEPARHRRQRAATLLLAYAAEPGPSRLLAARLRTESTGTDPLRIEFAKRQASLASMLFVCGDRDFTAHLLHWQRDPSIRSQMIENISQDIGPKAIGAYLARVNQESDPAIRQAMLLGLVRDELFKAFREMPGVWVADLIKIYREDADPGVHSAAERLLSTWKLHDAIADARESLRQGQTPAGRPLGARRWYIGPMRLTFTMVTPDAQARDATGKQVRPFAIATTEMSVKQVEDFCRLHPGYKPVARANTGFPSFETPLTVARGFCNWLTAQEMPTSEFCYEAEGMSLVPVRNFHERAGYRLPTFEEWKYACYAGVATPFPHGNDPELLKAYAVHRKKTGDLVPRHVGTLKPNQLGLFDLLGNAAEMCENHAGDIKLVGGSYRHWPTVPVGLTFSVGQDRDSDVARGFRVLRPIR